MTPWDCIAFATDYRVLAGNYFAEGRLPVRSYCKAQLGLVVEVAPYRIGCCRIVVV